MNLCAPAQPNTTLLGLNSVMRKEKEKLSKKGPRTLDALGPASSVVAPQQLRHKLGHPGARRRGRHPPLGEEEEEELGKASRPGRS